MNSAQVDKAYQAYSESFHGLGMDFDNPNVSQSRTSIAEGRIVKRSLPKDINARDILNKSPY